MSKLNEIMQQEISRQEFLRYIGLALLSLFGVAAFLQNLSNLVGQKSTPKSEQSSAGYGMTPYGR